MPSNGERLIGPHEDRELDLMLAGEKPLAVFVDPSVELIEDLTAPFAPHVRRGAIVERRWQVRDDRFGIDILVAAFALPGETWRIDRFRELQAEADAGQRPHDADFEREIGRLLGYPDAAIEAFIAQFGKPKP